MRRRMSMVATMIKSASMLLVVVAMTMAVVVTAIGISIDSAVAMGVTMRGAMAVRVS